MDISLHKCNSLPVFIMYVMQLDVSWYLIKMSERIDVVRHVRLHAVAYIGTLLLHNSS